MQQTTLPIPAQALVINTYSCLRILHQLTVGAQYLLPSLCAPTPPRKPTTRLSWLARPQCTLRARSALVNPTMSRTMEIADQIPCRTTSQKHCDPGRQPSTISITIILVATPRRTAPHPKQRERSSNRYVSWNYSARSA